VASGPNPTRHLHYTQLHQEQTNWCWSATTVSITEFYDPSTQWTQCSLVNQAHGLTTCCAEGASNKCNQPGWPDQALKITGHLASSEQASAPFEGVRKQIDAGHPVSIAINWDGGGGHSVVISGYDAAAPSGPTVDLQDPWFGPSTQDFNTFPSSYQSGGTWAETYTTR
jgi:hypothetical protein